MGQLKKKSQNRNSYEETIELEINFNDGDDIFNFSSEELEKMNKKEILKKLLKDEVKELLSYYGKRFNRNDKVADLKKKSERLSKAEIIDFIVNNEDEDEENWEDEYEYWDYDDDNYEEDGDDEALFFRKLKSYYLPDDFIDSVRSGKITFEEFKKSIKKWVLSMHPDRGWNNETEKEIKNRIIADFNEHKNFIMEFAEKFLKG